MRQRKKKRRMEPSETVPFASKTDKAKLTSVKREEEIRIRLDYRSKILGVAILQSVSMGWWLSLRKPCLACTRRYSSKAGTSKEPFKILFLGSDEFSIASLKAVIAAPGS